jgi:myo-inositol 2-dehydrogenase / D-chiro-inositol 1-dehydrogenase
MVSTLVVCDVDQDRAEETSRACGGAAHTSDFHELVHAPEIGGLIVATGEGQHFEPALAALQAGKTVLVEKPLVLEMGEASALTDAAAASGADGFIGYTQRFRRRYLSAKEHVASGVLGDLTSVFAKIYLSRNVGLRVMRREPRTTPSVNTLTYCADLLLWYLGGEPPRSVFAGAGRGRIHEEFGVPDSTWAIVEFANGPVATLGVSWELPEHHPAAVASMELELFGREGTLSIQDGHSDMVVTAPRRLAAPYTAAAEDSVTFVGSAMPGDWALGDFYGPMRDETDEFVRSVAGESTPALATLQDGHRALALTLAIDASARSGEKVEIAALDRWLQPT